MTQAVTCRNGHTWEWSDQQPTCPQCGATEALTMTRFTEAGTRTSIELTPPSAPAAAPHFAGYDVLESLGSGGMGVVFKARQHSPNRMVALKTFHTAEPLHPELRERFVAEANAVARLQHPNIIQIFEAGEHAGRRFLSLEFVDGAPLSRVLNRKPQPPARAAEIVEVLARAMQHAHLAGILHRDLKPGNVLAPRIGTNASGEPNYDFQRLKIADFGLAKDLAAADGPTQLGDVLGTPSYMAPEQASGVQKKLTPAVDVYALGAILYEALTGHPPFLGSSSAETVVQVLSQEPVPPRRLRPDCPIDLETICLKCLEKLPAKRYESAAALADDLQRYRTHQPILARPAGTMERIVKWARRKPAQATLAGGAAALALGLTIAGALYSAQLRRHNEQLQKLAQSERVAQQRATSNFLIASETVSEMTEIAADDLSHVPNLDSTRRRILQKALHLQRQLLEQDVANPAVKNDVAVAARRAGDIYVLLGDNKAAETHFRQASALHGELADQFPDNPLYRFERAQDLNGLGSLLGDMARSVEAESSFVEAAAILTRLINEHPDESSYAHQHARILINYGRFLGRSNRPVEAEAAFSQARDRLAALAEKHPTEPIYRERLAAAWVNLGLVRNASGQIGQSRIAYDRGGELLARLVDEYPEHRNYRWALAQMYTNQGNQLWGLGDRKAATLAYRFAYDTIRILTQRFPGIPEYRNSLAHCLENLGFALFRSIYFRADEPFWEQVQVIDLDAVAEGAILREEAVTEKRALAAEYPEVPDYHASLGLTYTNQALWHREHREWRSAEVLLDLSVRSFRQALTPDRTVRRYQNLLRDAIWYQSEIAMHLGRLDQSVALARSTAEMMPDDSTYFVYAAQLTAQCASAAREPAKSEQYLQATIELLRQGAQTRQRQIPVNVAGTFGGAAAVEAARRGWTDADVIRSLSEFQPLWSRPAMQDLLRELER